jgi:hypothetical protein
MIESLPGETKCLSASELLEYLDGELPAGRRTAFERHLEACRLCGAAAEGVAQLEWRDGFLRSVEAVDARIRARAAMLAAPREAAFRRVAAPQYLALAATLVVAAGAGLYLTRPTPGEALFAESFEPHPSTRPVVRGEAARDRLSEALARYESKSYAAAQAALETILSQDANDPTALFYSGVSHLCRKQPTLAVVPLERVLALGPTEFRPAAEWYLALARLEMNDLAGARSRLERIAASDGFYRPKAAALLAPLDRFPAAR